MKQQRKASLEHTLELTVPFETSLQADIAVKVLMPDPILRPEDFQVKYFSAENIMYITFRGIDDRVLRVGVSSVIDSLKTVIETMDEFAF